MNAWAGCHGEEEPYEMAFRFLRLNQTICVVLYGVSGMDFKEIIYKVFEDRFLVEIVNTKIGFDGLKEMIFD